MRYNLLLILMILPFFVPAQKKINVLATNSWTAAYARAAGVEQIDQLAPSTLQHPAEYELDYRSGKDQKSRFDHLCRL